MSRLKRHTKRIVIGIAGGLVVLLGLVLVPYPGPGWLIVFAGLAILATEFDGASKVLDFAKDKYDRWSNWLKRQHPAVQLLVLALTGLVVVTTVWLVNGFGIANAVLQLNQPWLISPLFR